MKSIYYGFFDLNRILVYLFKSWTIIPINRNLSKILIARQYAEVVEYNKCRFNCLFIMNQVHILQSLMIVFLCYQSYNKHKYNCDDESHNITDNIKRQST